MEGELEQLRDRLDLRRLVDEYALAVDGGDRRRFAGLFTPGGQLVVYEPDVADPVVTYTGGDELEKVLALVAAYSSTFHVMANHTSQVVGATATGDTYCLAHHLAEVDGRSVDTLMLIRYHDAFEKVDGAWRFARRDVLRQWTETHPAERPRLAF
jgi:hypothetical protein